MVCPGECYEARLPDAKRPGGFVTVEVIRQDGDRWLVRTLYRQREVLVEEWQLMNLVPAWLAYLRLEVYRHLLKNDPERAALWD